MAFNIVLFEPEIPTNTGNIGRLSLASGSRLHLVKPFGFEISDSRLKRAGLDYWKHISLDIYESIEEFYEKNSGGKFAYFSSHGTKEYCSIDFRMKCFLSSERNLWVCPKISLPKTRELVYTIPIYSPHIRSLNLANAVGIVVYEGLRSLKNSWKKQIKLPQFQLPFPYLYNFHFRFFQVHSELESIFD